MPIRKRTAMPSHVSRTRAARCSAWRTSPWRNGGRAAARVCAAGPPPEEDRHRGLEDEPEPARPREPLRNVLEEPHGEKVEAAVLVRHAQRARHRHREDGERERAEDEPNDSDVSFVASSAVLRQLVRGQADP